MVTDAVDSRLMAMLISSNEFATEDEPLNRARKAQRYIDLGHDEKEVAKHTRNSEATVKNLLRQLDAPAAVGTPSTPARSPRRTRTSSHGKSRRKPRRSRGARREGSQDTRQETLEERQEGPPGDGPARPSRAGGSLPEPSRKSVKKLEDAVAEAIAAWVEANWADGNWNGAPQDIPVLIRKGDWREHRDKAVG